MCMRGDHGNADSLYIGRYMAWEYKLLNIRDHVDVAERYSSRFHPDCIPLVEDARQRAKELDELKIALPAMSFAPSKWSLALL